MRTILFFIIAIIIFASCNSSRTNNNEITVINLPEIENLEIETRFLSEFSSEFEYIRPEAKSGSFFRMMGISYIGPKFVILFEKTTSQLFAFQRNGKFLGKLGEKGKGPNEYATLPRVFVFSDIEEIHITDFKRNQILRFDFNLNFKGNIKLNIVPSALCTYMDKFYLCAYNNDELKENEGKILVARDPVSFEEQNILCKIDTSSFTESIKIHGFDTNWLLNNNDTLYFAMQTSSGINIYNVLDSKLEQKYALTFTNKSNEAKNGVPNILIANMMFFYDYLVISYQYYFQIYTGYYNTKTNMLSRFKIINDLDKGIDFYPMGNCDDKGYYSDDIELDYFNDFWKTNESNTTFKNLKSKFPDREKWLKEVISQSQEDNPWIMVIN